MFEKMINYKQHLEKALIFLFVSLVLGYSIPQSYDVTANAWEMLLRRCCKWFMSMTNSDAHRIDWLLIDFFMFNVPCVGVPHGSGCHSWERPDSVPTREPALWVSPNRISSQTSGDLSFPNMCIPYASHFCNFVHC